MQMGTYRGKYDSRPQFFIAVGDSLKYDSPGEQIKDGYSMPCSLPSDEDVELRRYFRVCATQLFKGEMEALIDETASSSSKNKPVESTKEGTKLQTKTAEGRLAVGTATSKAPAADDAKLPAVTPNGLPMRKVYTELDFLCDRFEEEINFALALDMQKRQRWQHDGKAEIKIRSEVQFDEAARKCTLHIVNS